ncbi:MAG: glycosyltransferase family 39 protein [Nitrosarchaeum sp.]|nr:glycosyltransferase family 39 protein [Nitrosarchaeum sp.]
MLKFDIYKNKHNGKKYEWFYPVIITVIFFIVISYISFVHYQYIFNPDGLFYLNTGKQILSGDGENVSIVNAPMGGSIIYAVSDNIINDGFLTLKLFSILSGTGIVFVSYYIIRNIFSFKIAFLGQIFIAISPALQTRAVLATNELLALLFIFCGIYFFTKENIQRKDLIFAAICLGVASDIRYQAILVFIPFLIFLMFGSKNLKKNTRNTVLFLVIFVICLLPIFAYNLSVHGSLFDSDHTFYTMLDQRHDNLETENIKKFENSEMLSNSEITFRNYLDNLFFYNSNLLFNFFGNNAISIIPLIPYIAIIPVLGGFVGIIYEKINRKLIVQNLILLLVTLFLVLILGKLNTDFFIIITIPIIFLGIRTIKQIKKNLIPIIILAPTYLILISIVPLDRPDHLFSIWITISIMSSIFFLYIIPKIQTKFIKNSKTITMITFSLIFLVILSNVGFSYKIFEIYLYGTANEGIQKEIEKIFKEKESRPQIGYEIKQISEILKEEQNIEESYIMSNNVAYSYYTNAKTVYAFFTEGVKGESIIEYVTRENWTPFELYASNVLSTPADKFNKYEKVPNYLIYTPIKEELIDEKIKNETQILELKVLEDPKNIKIPNNFEMIFKSNNTGTVVYKINWEN